MRTSTLLPAVLLLSGCGTLGLGSREQLAEAPAGVAYSVQPGSAVPGGSAVVTLRNGSNEPIGYNLCIGALERREADLWVPALSSANACSPALSMLAPGEEASAETALPAGLEGGDYRFVTQVGLAGNWARSQVRSESFSVSGPES